MGYRMREDGKWEADEYFYTRIESAIRLYGAIIQTPVGAFSLNLSILSLAHLCSSN